MKTLFAFIFAVVAFTPTFAQDFSVADSLFASFGQAKTAKKIVEKEYNNYVADCLFLFSNGNIGIGQDISLLNETGGVFYNTDLTIMEKHIVRVNFGSFITLYNSKVKKYYEVSSATGRPISFDTYRNDFRVNLRLVTHLSVGTDKYRFLKEEGLFYGLGLSITYNRLYAIIDVPFLKISQETSYRAASAIGLGIRF